MFLSRRSSGAARSRARWQRLAQECQQRLTDQTIVPGNPGTILKDVESFLEVVGPGEIVTRRGEATVPPAWLPELNSKSSYPLESPLKRPLLRDYPNLSGIFILLRAMDLIQLQERHLVVSSPALQSWRSLNPTEQYFALLEALLFEARPSMLGKGRQRFEFAYFELLTLFLTNFTERWQEFEEYEAAINFGPRGEIPSWTLFVQQQLGILETQPLALADRNRSYSVGRGWLPGAARLTPWGTAVTWALLNFLKEGLDAADIAEADQPAPAQTELSGIGSNPLPVPSDSEAGQPHASERFEDAEEEVDFELDEDLEEVEPEPGFGVLQPVFQPYFPELKAAYARPKAEIQPGARIFKVSLDHWRTPAGGAWRRLAVPADSTLDDLALTILAAFRFDDDHLYDFRYRDRRGRDRVYNRPECHDSPFTTDITVGELELPLKSEMLFTFDYGDDWRFHVCLEKIDPASRILQPKVIESKGKAPKQYSSGW